MLLGLQESCNKSFEAAANCQPCAYSWLKVCRVASKNWPRTDAWDVGKVDGILDVQIQSIFDLYPIQCFWAVPADLHAFALLSSHVEFGSSRTRMDVWSSRKLWSLPLGRCTCPSWRNSRARCTSAEGSSGCCTVHGESTFCYELLRFYCSRHMHGNFVMQKVIQTLPSNSLASWSTNWRKGWEEIARDWWDWRGQAERMCSCIFLQGFISSFQWGECSGGGIAYLCLSRAATSYRMLWGGNNWLGGHFAAARHLFLNAFFKSHMISRVLLCYLQVVFHSIIYTTNFTAPQTSVSQPALGPIVLKPGRRTTPSIGQRPLQQQRVSVESDRIG